MFRFIIYGWGRTTDSVKGHLSPHICRTCGYQIEDEVVCRRTWFTLFFVPVIPYRTEYFVRCPACKSGVMISKEQFKTLEESAKAQPGLPEGSVVSQDDNASN